MNADIATEPRGSAKLRKVIFGAALAVVPAAIGGAIGLVTRSRRNGLVAGGITALGLGIARWQFERTFNDEPDYTVEDRVGELEIRRYDARVEGEAIYAAFDPPWTLPFIRRNEVWIELT